jgi:lytic murein transglycosylase
MEIRLPRLATLLALLCAALGVAAPAAAQSIDAQFRQWLANDLWPAAQQERVSRKTFDAAFDGVTPDLKLPDLVLPGQKPADTQHQAEFRSPGAYFAENTVRGVTAGGRGRAQTHAQALAAVQQATGVPGPIILAIWGRESGFGTAKIPHDAIRVLATKAFASTRKEMFRKEILAALVMMERGVPRSRMKSSWAGALGQPQFLPTSYLAHAADGDGDRVADIWNSVPDTLASIGSYLAHFGWQKGRDWGFEVTVPDSVSCSLEGPDQGRTFAEWAAAGVTRVSGRPFPAGEMGREGFLMMPAGRHGPAFVVTANFYVLKAYNESDLYALFVGHAADRIAHGDRTFSAGWGQVGGLKRSNVATMQRALVAQGHDVGGADGLAGFKTRRSIGRWQEANGMAATCFPDASMIRALR